MSEELTMTHVFEMELTPHGAASKITLDGVDISGLLAGVEVVSTVNGGTSVHLHPARGQVVKLKAALPASCVTIAPGGIDSSEP